MTRSKRWRLLGMQPPFAADQPASMQTADLLAYSLRSADETEDPIVGFLESAQNDLHVIALRAQGTDGARFLSASLLTIARRIEVAALLLRRADRFGEREGLDIRESGSPEPPTTQPSTP